MDGTYLPHLDAGKAKSSEESRDNSKCGAIFRAQSKHLDLEITVEETLGIDYCKGIEGISLWMNIILSFLMLLSLFSSFHQVSVL